VAAASRIVFVVYNRIQALDLTGPWEVLGASPADYVERVRIERARTLLEDGAEGLEQVASRCGFRSAEVMRRAFQRRLRTSPSEYRERFQLALA